MVGMHFVEHAKTMLFIVREPHGDLPERVQKYLFSRARCEGAPGSIWKRIWADFLRFLCFSKVPGIPIFREKSRFFAGLILNQFLNHFWEGPAAGGRCV